jgi:hypothetical protein
LPRKPLSQCYISRCFRVTGLCDGWNTEFSTTKVPNHARPKMYTIGLAACSVLKCLLINLTVEAGASKTISFSEAESPNNQCRVQKPTWPCCTGPDTVEIRGEASAVHVSARRGSRRISGPPISCGNTPPKTAVEAV